MNFYIAAGFFVFLAVAITGVYEHGVTHEEQAVKAATAKAQAIQSAEDAKKQTAIQADADMYDQMDDESTADYIAMEKKYDAEVKKHPHSADCNLSPAVMQDLNGTD